MNTEHSMTSELVRLHSGRIVEVHRRNEQDGGRAVVFCHPAPGSGAFAPLPESDVPGLAPLGVSRPGYGRSDAVQGDAWATVGNAADDLAEVLDARGVRGAGVVGWSAGGRVALALAARRPDLVDRVVVVATPAPNEEVRWVPPELSAGLDALRGLPPEAVHAALEGQFAAFMPGGFDADAALEMLGRTEADEAALAEIGAREALAGMLRGAFAQGMRGVAQDLAGYMLRPWGFETADVRAQTLLLYGASDPVTDARHGEWWARRLPNARLEVVPNAGHLVMVSAWPRVLADLVAGPLDSGTR